MHELPKYYGVLIGTETTYVAMKLKTSLSAKLEIVCSV